MSDSPERDAAPAASFLARWSQRKREQQTSPDTQAVESEVRTLTGVVQADPVHEQELPSIESLTEDSEVGMFLSDGISEAIQRKVLRKIFHMGKFNVCDGLDDYAEDYTFFEPLEPILQAQKQLRQVTENVRQGLAQEPGSATASKADTQEEAISIMDANENEEAVEGHDENNEG